MKRTPFAYGFRTTAFRIGMQTPWGGAQTATLIAPGIGLVSTAGHGGIKLSDTRNAHIPKPFRDAGGWYEEDVEINIVILTFPTEWRAWYGGWTDVSTGTPFREMEGFEARWTAYLEDAHKALRYWMPFEYMDAFKTVIPANETPHIRRALLNARGFGDRIVERDRLDRLLDGQPCAHPGCLAHVSHRCEGCGRVRGLWYAHPEPVARELTNEPERA